MMKLSISLVLLPKEDRRACSLRLMTYILFHQ